MAVKHKKKTTLEDLAGMTQRGFMAIDARFDAVDVHFEAARRGR